MADEKSRANFAAILKEKLPQVYDVHEPIPLREDEVEVTAEVDYPSFHRAVANLVPTSQIDLSAYPLPPTVVTDDTLVLNQRFEAIAISATNQLADRPVPRDLPPIVPTTTTFNNHQPIVVLSDEQFQEVAPLMDKIGRAHV